MIVTAQASGSFLHRFLQTHALLHFVEVVSSLLCETFLQLHSATRQVVIRRRCRNIHIDRNLMIKAQIRVDIGCRDLTSRNRIDNGRRSCYAVSTRVGTEDIVYDAVFLGLNIAAEYRNPKLFKEVDIRSLSDGRNDDICKESFPPARRNPPDAVCRSYRPVPRSAVSPKAPALPRVCWSRFWKVP